MGPSSTVVAPPPTTPVGIGPAGGVGAVVPGVSVPGVSVSGGGVPVPGGIVVPPPPGGGNVAGWHAVGGIASRLKSSGQSMHWKQCN